MTRPHVELRQWKNSDLNGFAEMNADPEVMRYFLAPLTFGQSREAMDWFRQGIDEQGWGLWAIEVEGEFAGFTGLSEPSFTAAFTPCIEIGWRLRSAYWGRGIAFAAARKAEAYAFAELGLDRLVSFTTATNLRSRKLMERLGFNHDPADNFEHPKVAKNHPLLLHVLYTKEKPQPETLC